MKPDWKDAPEWAEWLAMDADGEWYWYSKKPFCYVEYCGWGSDGRTELAGVSEPTWTQTRTQRPQTTKPAEAGSEGQGA